ncbi:T3SS effector HopA1 family protein [Dyadobacter frigoris]|uniref:Uncharacterized protein n=1 Tax=Dyadobacter frigoris TaxID=2576211 RepID=A0A4U6D8J9_9BACT|nr:T3SS effector HopA1 family protein [Dyadobacter frigoris]TKT92671.1 hypothetical protein FDK13_07605 [Dyadobacter frigoris]
MKEDYKETVIKQIQNITSMITMVDDELVDLKFTGEKIVNLLRSKYGIEISLTPAHPDFRKIVLTNWIYTHYYQNSGERAITPRSEERHFPFDEIFKQGTDGYWRNRFWRYDQRDQERERPALTRGYETIIAESNQSVEDEIVFECKKGRKGNLIFEEIPFLSISLPKFQFENGYKYVNGKYPLDNAGLASIVRFYFHLKIDTLTVSIPLLILKISDLFNDRLISFRLKFSFTNDEFKRSDHFVLYVERRHFDVAAILIRWLHQEIEPFLDNRLPFFVKQVLSGIGFGSTPHQQSSSFGVFRSKVIADAILFLLEGNDGRPVREFLDEMWGGLEKFYLNPNSPFVCDFSIFDKSAENLFSATITNKPLAAAWYIARLLCREAIWVSENECNWMNYELLHEKQYGYRLMNVDNGLSGLQGVIKFLESFQKLKIKDPVIKRVLNGAKQFYNSRRTVPRSSGGIAIPPEVFATEMIPVVHSAIQDKQLHPLTEYSLLMDMISKHIEMERPVNNMLDGSDHFCADMRYGYASYGYACLRLHNSISIVELQL